jgi:hypothetical protein
VHHDLRRRQTGLLERSLEVGLAAALGQGLLHPFRLDERGEPRFAGERMTAPRDDHPGVVVKLLRLEARDPAGGEIGAGLEVDLAAGDAAALDPRLRCVHSSGATDGKAKLSRRRRGRGGPLPYEVRRDALSCGTRAAGL